MTKIIIQQKLHLVMFLLKFLKGRYFNTNDLVRLAEQYNKSEVRVRVDKDDHKFGDDTRRGGLRGNFSNILSFIGFYKKGNTITPYHGLGYKNKIINALYNGDIILNKEDGAYYAHTKKLALMKLIVNTNSLYLIKEQQSHIKIFLETNPQFNLQRANEFPKQSIVKTYNNVYFLRAKINNFKEDKVVEYNLKPYWEGNKLKLHNINLLIVLINSPDGWGDMYALPFEELYKFKNLFLYVNIDTLECRDESNNKYKLIPFNKAKDNFKDNKGNIELRLDYNWGAFKKEAWDKDKIQQENKDFKKDEYSLFVDLFLEWNNKFIIQDKEVVDIEVSSSGGPDVKLIFKDGTSQFLELEHKWKNYLDHEHHFNSAWENTWIWAEELFDEEVIFKIFHSHTKGDNRTRIPTNFLGIDKNKQKNLFTVDWKNKKVKRTEIKFL